jgi:hypothetical protein
MMQIETFNMQRLGTETNSRHYQWGQLLFHNLTISINRRLASFLRLFLQIVNIKGRQLLPINVHYHSF